MSIGNEYPKTKHRRNVVRGYEYLPKIVEMFNLPDLRYTNISINVGVKGGVKITMEWIKEQDDC